MEQEDTQIIQIIQEQKQEQKQNEKKDALGKSRTIHFPHWKGSQRIKDYDQPRQSEIDQYFIDNGYQILKFKQLTNAGHQYDLVDLTSRKRYIAKHFNYEMQFDQELSIIHKIDQIAKKIRLKTDLKQFIDFSIKSNEDHLLVFYEIGACNLAELSEEQNKNGVYWFDREPELFHLIITLNNIQQNLFRNGIYHGNMKPENVVFQHCDKDVGKLNIKLIDFGLTQTKTFRILDGITEAYSMEIELQENQLIQDHEFKQEVDRQQFENYALGRTLIHIMLDSVESFEKQRHRHFEIIGQKYSSDVSFMPNTQNNNKNIIQKLSKYYSKDLIDLLKFLVIEKSIENFGKKLYDLQNSQGFLTKHIYDHQNWVFNVLETSLDNRSENKIENEEDFIKDLEISNSLKLYKRTLHQIKKQKKKPVYNINSPKIIFCKLQALFQLKYFRKLKNYVADVKEQLDSITDRSSDFYWEIQYFIQRTVYENVDSSGLMSFLNSYESYFYDIYGETSSQYYKIIIKICNMYISYIPCIIYATQLGQDIQKELTRFGNILLNCQSEDFQNLEVKRYVKQKKVDNTNGEEFNPLYYAFGHLFIQYGKGIYKFTDRATDFQENVQNLTLAIQALKKWSLDKLYIYSELVYIRQLYSCIYEGQMKTERETMLDQLQEENNLLINIQKSMGSGNFLNHFTLASNICTMIKYGNYGKNQDKIKEIREKILEVFWAQEEANFVITEMTKPLFMEFGQIVKEFWEENFPSENFKDLKLYFLKQMRIHFLQRNYSKAKSYLLITERFLDLLGMIDNESQKDAKQSQKWLEKVYYYVEFRRLFEKCKNIDDQQQMKVLANKFKTNFLKSMKLQKMQEEQIFPFYLMVLFESYLEISKRTNDYQYILNEYYQLNQTVIKLREQFQESYQICFTLINIYQAFAHYQLGEYEVAVFLIDETKKQINQNTLIQQNRKCRLKIPKKEIDQSDKEYAFQGFALISQWYSKTKIFIQDE